MSLKHYFELSVGVFLLAIATAYFFSVPVLPFAVLVLCGETLIGFQVEDHKVPRALKSLWIAAKPHDHSHSHS